MLSLAKLRVGQEAYQLSGVAESLDAYYTGAGEAPGEWIGGGAARLGLDGEVGADDLRAVLAGMAPGSGGLSPNGTTIRPHRKRVPGFDATFKVPKSASVLYAVSDDPRVQGAVIDAGNHAVREAIGWLEREAIEVQRGSHNMAWVDKQAGRAGRRRGGPVDGRAAPVEDVAGWSGRRSGIAPSRAGDPLLHWHVLIANLVEGADGQVVGVRPSRPVPARPGGRRGVPGGVPGRADPHPRGGVAARAARPGDRRDPPGAARPVLQAARRDRGVAGGDRIGRPTPPVNRRRCWPPGATSRSGKGNGSTPAGRSRPTRPAGGRRRPTN